MNTIEMAGTVGAGKTTLADALRVMLTQRDVEVFDVKDAIELAMKRSNLGGLFGWLLRAPSHRRTASVIAYRALVRPWHEMWFITHHLHLTRLVLRTLRHLPLPIWHRRRIFRLFLRRAASLEFLRSRIGPGEILIVEEGLVQRAVNIFAWDRHAVDQAAVTEYLTALPSLDLVLFVEIAEPTSFERASLRGLPARLAGHTEDAVERFMMHAVDVASITVTYLEQTDGPFYIIENGGPLDRTLDSLEAIVEDQLASGMGE